MILKEGHSLKGAKDVPARMMCLNRAGKILLSMGDSDFDPVGTSDTTVIN